jgi:hypothetical protein
VERCLGFGGARVDQAVVAEVLETIRPLGIQAALDAWDHSQNVEDEKQRSLKLALEKAHYEAGRIERQYDATEPENRLVAAELEKRWNAALAHVAELEARIVKADSSTVQLVLLCYKETRCCRIVLWVHACRRQAHNRSALRHTWKAWRKPQGMQIVLFR